jgi:hypothetical protein
MVDLPAPVEPVMANIPLEIYSGAVKLTAHSPLSELRFLNLSARIFMISFSIPHLYLLRGEM